jgi:hypothetical protein
MAAHSLRRCVFAAGLLCVRAFCSALLVLQANTFFYWPSWKMANMATLTPGAIFSMGGHLLPALASSGISGGYCEHGPKPVENAIPIIDIATGEVDGRPETVPSSCGSTKRA